MTTDKKISPVALIITIIGLLAIAAALIYSRMHPLPAPVPADTTQTAATDQQSETVCYYLDKPSVGAQGNDVAYFKLTVGVGTDAKGELGTAIAEKDKMSGTLEGTIAPSTDPNSDGYTFTGQYANMGEGMTNTDPITLTFDSKSASDQGLIIPRVDCAQYDSLRGNAQ